MNMMRATTADLDRYRTLRLRALELDPDNFFSTLERELEFDRQRWHERLASADSATFIAVSSDGQDVGTVTARPLEDGAAYEITSMWVDAAWRGQGVARRLLRMAVSFAREQGASQAVLWLAMDNSAAMRLYESEGFRPTGATGSFPPPRLTPETEMALDLSPEAP